MCGIVGMLAWDQPWPTPGVLRGMCDTIVHRGPDDEGVYVDGPIGLGMRRLSIIDVAGGAQPIFNETREIAIVFNGEIYNYRELRQRLEAHGHQFTTKSDTEVVVHLYEEQGEWCLRDLRGMFALAIWDGRRRAVVLGRDRFGKKPLYYSAHPRGIVFASELKALMGHPAVERRFDPEAINQFLTFGNSLGESSILASVRKLPPGHVLVATKGQLKVQRYWEWRTEEDSSLTERQVVQRLRELLDEAVRIRLMSEVPLGAFLSGGLDSSTVVAFMSHHSERPVTTFAIGFGEAGFDELRFARAAARHFETNHHELVLDPGATDVLPQLVWYLDEPFADSSAIPTYFLCKLAREHVTVALSGDGGDEMFAGYPAYRADQVLDHVRRVPRDVRSWVLEQVITPLATHSRGVFHRGLERTRRNLERVDLSPEDRFLSRHCLFPDHLRQKILTEDAQALLAPSHHPSRWVTLHVNHSRGPVNRALHLDVNVYLPNDMLVKVDRLSMAHSLEVRCPLLDHELAEFMATVPPRYKVRNRVTKHILRKAMAGLLPPSILHRGKQGFCVPLDRWFQGSLVTTARELLHDSVCTHRGLLTPGGVSELLSQHERGVTGHGERIWALIMLEMWCRVFLDPACPTAAQDGDVPKTPES